MKKYGVFQRINRISLKNKLLISYILLVFLPVISVGLILTNGMRKMALDHAIQEASSSVDKIEKRTVEILKVPVDVSKKFYVDIQLKSILSKRYRSTWEVVKAYRDYNEFDQYDTLYEEIAGIRMYIPNDTLLNNWRFIKTTEPVLQSFWYQEALKHKGKVEWNYIYDETKNRYYLCLIRLINGIGEESLGVMAIDVDTGVLDAILEEEPFDTVIEDDKGIVIAAKDHQMVGKTLKEFNLSYSDISNDGIFDMTYQQRLSKVIVNSFVPNEGSNRFRVISIFPVNSIVREAEKKSILGFSIIAASLILSLILIIAFSDFFTRRIKLLSREMHRVAQGDFRPCSVGGGEDEIGQLSNDLNVMVDSIKSLMHEVYEVNLQKKQLIIQQKEIKLNMLSNQMNPHFLFNTLETIRMKAYTSGQDDIAEVIKLLGKLLRRNLETGNEPVPVENEMELVKSYLIIQKFRFGSRIDFRIHVEDPAVHCKILPFVIQPLVENAVVHGLENKEEGGTVSIEVKWKSDLLRIIVQDNGIGISLSRLEKVKETLDKPGEGAGKGIGLGNIHQRVKLYYGESYGLVIESREGWGTRVCVTLPIKE